MAKESVRGLLMLEELRQKVENGEVETVVTVFPDLYGRFFGKRITGDFFSNTPFSVVCTPVIIC
jgi:glutamine synthetase